MWYYERSADAGLEFLQVIEQMAGVFILIAIIIGAYYLIKFINTPKK